MVPSQRYWHKPRRGFDNAIRLKGVLVWVFATWIALIGVPVVDLYPNYGLTRPLVLGLVFLQPLVSLLAALTGRVDSVLAISLIALVPALVACPQLAGDQNSDTVRAVVVASVALALVFAVFRHRHRHEDGDALWSQLMSRLRQPRERHYWLIAALWLAAAWWCGGQLNGNRSLSLVAVVILWSLLRVRHALSDDLGATVADGVSKRAGLWRFWLGRLLMIIGLSWTYLWWTGLI